MDKNKAPHQTEILESPECWQLLRSGSVGRLAVRVDEQVDIFPVNCVVDHETVVFRTGGGSKFQAVLGDAKVAFEADQVSEDVRVAWSVVVKGQAAALDENDPALETARRFLFPWEGGSKEQFIRIAPDSITGRRLAAALPLAGQIPLDDATRAGLE